MSALLWVCIPATVLKDHCAMGFFSVTENSDLILTHHEVKLMTAIHLNDLQWLIT